MGNCANKPLTEEGGAPAPEEKPVETTEREIVLDQPKVITTDVAADDPTKISLAQMLEEEEKKPEAAEASKPAAEEKPSLETPKPEVVAAEIKKEEVSKTAAEPAKAEASVPKKEETKPAETPVPATDKKP